MGIRNRFSKADQDQLGLFLATHPGDRSGNAIYQEFAQTVDIRITRGKHGDTTISTTLYSWRRLFGE